MQKKYFHLVSKIEEQLHRAFTDACDGALEY